MGRHPHIFYDILADTVDQVFLVILFIITLMAAQGITGQRMTPVGKTLTEDWRIYKIHTEMCLFADSSILFRSLSHQPYTG